MKHILINTLCSSIALYSTQSIASNELPSPAQMWRVLQVQQLELHDLKKQLRSQNKRIDVHENKVQETADIAKSAKQSTESLSEYLHWKTW